MENASKALIIAGAILLSILIISLGIMIYNQAAGTVDSTAMDEMAVTTFNKKFQQYEGSNVRGTQVNALLNTIVQNNLSNSSDSSKIVKVQIKSSPWISDGGAQYGEYSYTPSDDKAPVPGGKAQTGKAYKVEVEPDSKSGYITKVIISSAT